MARKNGLNRKEQILCAKWLDEGISPTDIAKKFGTSVKIVKLFTKKALKEAAAKAKARLEGQGKAAKQIKQTAEVLKETLEQAKIDFE